MELLIVENDTVASVLPLGPAYSRIYCIVNLEPLKKMCAVEWNFVINSLSTLTVE